MNFTGTPGELAANLVSTVSASYQATSTEGTYHRTRAEQLRTQETSGGVDTDQELQKLLLIEKSYAANARIIQVMDELLETVLRI